MVYFAPDVAPEWVALFCIQEVFGSNLCPEIEYTN
jgi:hypothetical protein